MAGRSSMQVCGSCLTYIIIYGQYASNARVQRQQRMHAINRVAGTPCAGESEYSSRPTHTPQLAFFTNVTTFSDNANFVAQHAAQMQCEPISPKRMEQQIYATIYSGYTHVHFLPTLKEKASSYDPCQKIQPVDLRPAPRSQGRGQRQAPTTRIGKQNSLTCDPPRQKHITHMAVESMTSNVGPRRPQRQPARKHLRPTWRKQTAPCDPQGAKLF